MNTCAINSVVDPPPSLYNDLNYICDRFLPRYISHDNFYFSSSPLIISTVFLSLLLMDKGIGLGQSGSRPVTDCDLGASFRCEGQCCCTTDPCAAYIQLMLSPYKSPYQHVNILRCTYQMPRQ